MHSCWGTCPFLSCDAIRLARCGWVSSSDLGFLSHVHGGLELESLHPPSHLGEGPRPRLAPHSLLGWRLGLHLGLWAPAWGGPALMEHLGRGSWSRTHELVLVAGEDLQPFSCGPPTLPLPTGLSASLSTGQMAQPCQLMDMHPLPLDLRPGLSLSHSVPGRSCGSSCFLPQGTGARCRAIPTLQGKTPPPPPPLQPSLRLQTASFAEGGWQPVEGSTRQAYPPATLDLEGTLQPRSLGRRECGPGCCRTACPATSC